MISDHLLFSMKIILFGASGMIGKGVLLECLEDKKVTEVLVIGRNSCEMQHKKLTEIQHNDFMDFSAVKGQLKGYDACFYCLGISSVGMSKEKYTLVTYDFTIAAAKVLADQNPGMLFCFVSGQGTDSTGKAMWARVKGKTEDDLRLMPFKKVILFRPGYIQPMNGTRSKVRLYQALYVVFKPLYPILKRLFPSAVTTTVNIGRAMINSVSNPPSRSILNSSDINELAAG